MTGYCDITCGSCKNTADLDSFCRPEIGGELPRGTFQCPACLIAWSLVPQGEATAVRSLAGEIVGVIPPSVKIVAVDSRL